jgi:hypothetical protein
MDSRRSRTAFFAAITLLVPLSPQALAKHPSLAAEQPPATASLSPQAQSVLNAISADALRGRLSFIASDALEGRGTPSRGLDIAAEYIASEFRRAGLEPVGDDGYFQTAEVNLPARGGAPPTEGPVRVRNVVGVLRGSDPVLKDTYILVTAHYDHLGTRGTGEGDRIYNGANDDGSGTVSVMEIASVLAKMNPKPKRSIVFMTFFGEERGLLGSRHYGRQPIFPLEKTIAQINLEQIGRTDDREGPRVGAANLTGFDYSDVGTFLQRGAELTGVRLEKHPTASDAYFGRSDNQALADLGIPAHTVSVAYMYPDYHGVGDHWDKIDYANMAKVNRMVAAGILILADSPTEPRWNANNPKAARYLQAWQARHPAN